jgi:hypothetical protein
MMKIIASLQQSFVFVCLALCIAQDENQNLVQTRRGYVMTSHQCNAACVLCMWGRGQDHLWLMLIE